MADGENVIKDECAICNLVLIAAGLAVAGILAFMALDLATDGKLSAGFTKATGLASVTELVTGDESDAG